MSNDENIIGYDDFKKSPEKIFLVQRSFSGKRLQKKILNIIKDFPNPYPPDIFTWDNQEKITDIRGKYNKMFFAIVENTKEDIVKTLIEEELENHAKEVELTPELEQKAMLEARIESGVVKEPFNPVKWLECQKLTIQKLRESIQEKGYVKEVD